MGVGIRGATFGNNSHTSVICCSQRITQPGYPATHHQKVILFAQAIASSRWLETSVSFPRRHLTLVMHSRTTALLAAAKVSDRIDEMMRALMIMVLFFAVTNAHAQDYYQCKKKGHHNGLTNMASKIAAYQKAGYRCRWYMGTGKSRARRGRSPARTNKKRRSSTTRYTSTPRRSSGPAGQRQTYEPLIQHAAKLYNVDPNLIRAVIKIESGYHPRAISSAGAKGLMQLMPTISSELQVTDLFDPPSKHNGRHSLPAYADQPIQRRSEAGPCRLSCWAGNCIQTDGHTLQSNRTLCAKGHHRMAEISRSRIVVLDTLAILGAHAEAETQIPKA